MDTASRAYARRFNRWEFWVALIAVLVDVVSFAIPLFALAFLVVLFQPQGWRWMGWVTELLRRIQEGEPDGER